MSCFNNTVIFILDDIQGLTFGDKIRRLFRINTIIGRRNTAIVNDIEDTGRKY